MTSVENETDGDVAAFSRILEQFLLLTRHLFQLLPDFRWHCFHDVDMNIV